MSNEHDVAANNSTGNVAYYDALASDYHLFFSDLEENMEEEGEWLARVLGSFRATKVLDASCGGGRQAVPLSKRGFQVTAADPSGAMLSEAQACAHQHQVHIPLVQAGFADLTSHFAGEFDAVIALGNGLCNQERAEQIEGALRSLFACCRNGGVCLVGIKDFEAIRRDGERFHGHRIVDHKDERTILFEVWDFQGPTLIVTAYLLRQQQDVSNTSVVAAQTREYMLHEAELREMALRVGFRTVSRLDHPSEAVFALHR